jgi:hypothetical protein
MRQFLGGRSRYRFSNSTTKLRAPPFAFFLAKGEIARTLPAVFLARPDNGCTRKRPLPSHPLPLRLQIITLPRRTMVP